MKRRDEVLVGIFFTVALVVAILGALWLARGGLSQGYPLYASFPWGAGLKQGQPVLLAGVNVGYVEEIQLRQDGTLLVTFRVQDEYPVPETSTATVIPSGIFGDMAIALTPQRPTPEAYEPGDTIPTGISPPGISDIVARLDTVTRNVTTVTDALELQLVEGGGIADLRRTLAGTNALVAQLGQIAAVQARELGATSAALRRAATAVDSADVAATVANLRQTTENLATLTTDVQQTTRQLNTVLAQLNDTTGTAGQLINNPALYDRLTTLVGRLDSLTADFQRNPRRYINLEIF